MLVLAGAGTGKTRVLTTRLAHILASGRANPGEMLAVTFTNKAAREMRERLEAMIGRAADGVWLGTFHALAARILRRHAEAVGLTVELRDSRHRRPASSAETDHRGGEYRRAALAGAGAARHHRALEGSRPRSRQGPGGATPGTGPMAAPSHFIAIISSVSRP